jgi:hypothetical protein
MMLLIEEKIKNGYILLLLFGKYRHPNPTTTTVTEIIHHHQFY